MAGLSKIWYGTLSYNCYELGHTWSHSCPKAIHMFGSNAFEAGLKLYAVFYLADFLIRKEKLSWTNLKKLVINILQSTTFIGVTGYVFLLAVCILRHSLGYFTIYTAAYVPGLISSILGVLVERKNRRCALTLYVANVASETLFRMLKARNMIKPLPYGEVLLFSCSMAIYMYQLKKCQSPDFISKFLKYLFLGAPSSNPITNGTSKTHQEDSTTEVNCNGQLKHHRTMLLKSMYLRRILKDYWVSIIGRLQKLPKSPHCSHIHSCLHSILCGFSRAFGIGYVLRLALGLLPSLAKIVKNPSLLRHHVTDKKNLQLGLFFGSFVAIFKSVSCCLRWLTKSDDPIHTLPAGFLAGLSMCFYRNSTVALYVAWRVIEITYRTGMNAGHLPRWDAGVLLLYMTSTALLFHAAVIEPHNLKPTYYKFLDRMTGGLIGQVNRTLIEEIGAKSNTMFPDYLPDLDRRFMTEGGIRFMKRKLPNF